MSPTLLSKFQRAGEPKFDYTAMSKRPELAAKVAEVITTWSYIEASFGNVLVDALGAESGVAIAMYSSINSALSQRSLLDAVMRKKLSTADFKIYTAVSMMVSPLAKQRHKFAHHIWGYLPDNEKYLVLSEPQVFWSNRSDTYINSLNKEMIELADIARTKPYLDLSRTLVYRKKDFDEIALRFRSAFYFVSLFQAFVSDHPQARIRHDHIYNLLCNEPDIRRCLHKLENSKQKSSALPELLHHTTDVY